MLEEVNVERQRTAEVERAPLSWPFVHGLQVAGDGLKGSRRSRVGDGLPRSL